MIASDEKLISLTNLSQYDTDKINPLLQSVTVLAETLISYESRIGALEAQLEELLRNTLPAGYIELQYIENDGASYIDTGLTLDGAMTIIIDMAAQKTGITIPGAVAHNSQTTADGRMGFMMFNTSSHKVDYFWPNVGYNTLTVDSGIDFNKKTRVVQSQTRIEVTQGTITSSATYSGTTATNTSKLQLLHSENPNHNTYYNGRIYYCQITKGTEVLREFIPVKYGSDIGLYDLVTKSMFLSAGSGSFVAGPVAS